MSSNTGAEVAKRLMRNVRTLVDDFARAAKSSLTGLRPIVLNPYDESLRVLVDMVGRRAKAVGIDGSMVRQEALEMLIFYACSTAYQADVYMLENKFMMDRSGASRVDSIASYGVVPLWVEKAEEITSRDYYTGEEMQGALDSLSFSLMTLAELYSAVKAVRSGFKVVFLDRSLSGTYQSLQRDARALIKKGRTGLSAVYSEMGFRDELLLMDLELSLILGPPGYEPPSHGTHVLRYFVYKALVDGVASVEEVSERLGLDKNEREKLRQKARRLESNGLLREELKGLFSLNEGLEGFRDRAKALVDEVVKRLFEGSSDHPLLVSGRWLTSLDLNTVGLLLLQSLFYEARRRNVLLIGLVKDTNVSDLTRCVIPFLSSRGLVGGLDRTYGSDRSLLTILSSQGVVEPPWRTIAYDSSFAMLMFDGGVLRASRKRTGFDRLFVRCFFQSRKGSRVSSPVFLYDRPVYPVDEKLFVSLDVFEKKLAGYGLTKATMVLEVGSRSELDDAILIMMESSDNPEVIEAYGHNHLLFLADKAVKLDARLKSSALKGIVSLELAPYARSERLNWILRRFREERLEAERARGW